VDRSAYRLHWPPRKEEKKKKGKREKTPSPNPGLASDRPIEKKKKKKKKEKGGKEGGADARHTVTPVRLFPAGARRGGERGKKGKKGERKKKKKGRGKKEKKRARRQGCLMSGAAPSSPHLRKKKGKKKKKKGGRRRAGCAVGFTGQPLRPSQREKKGEGRGRKKKKKKGKRGSRSSNCVYFFARRGKKERKGEGRGGKGKVPPISYPLIIEGRRKGGGGRKRGRTGKPTLNALRGKEERKREEGGERFGQFFLLPPGIPACW